MNRYCDCECSLEHMTISEPTKAQCELRLREIMRTNVVTYYTPILRSGGRFKTTIYFN